MAGYTTPAAVRTAANPDWAPGVPNPSADYEDASSLTDGQLQAAIDSASARIDSFLGDRYATPVPNGDSIPFLADLTTTLALYLATLTYRRGLPLEPTDPVALRYAAALADLTAIRDGKQFAPLPDVDTGGTDGSGSAGMVDPGGMGTFDQSDAGFHSRDRAISPYYVDGAGNWTGPWGW